MKAALFLVIEVLEFLVWAIKLAKNDKLDKVSASDIEEVELKLRMAKESL